MKIGIIGAGVVGKSIARTYLEFVDEIRVYDKYVRELRTHEHPRDFLDCDILFVCVPEDELEKLFQHWCTTDDPKNYISGFLNHNWVIKSTVPVGTTKRLREKYGLSNLVHSPEFLTARCAETDARVPAVNVIGSPTGLTLMRNDVKTFYPGPGNSAHRKLWELYDRRFPGTCCINMTSDESEFLKIALNSTFAVKVSWFNELRQLSDKLGLDWETIRSGMLADGRLTAHHTRVPGPDGKRGFGNKCLPKDLGQFIACYYEHNATLTPIIAQAAAIRNSHDRKEGGK